MALNRATTAVGDLSPSSQLIVLLLAVTLALPGFGSDCSAKSTESRSVAVATKGVGPALSARFRQVNNAGPKTDPSRLAGALDDDQVILGDDSEGLIQGSKGWTPPFVSGLARCMIPVTMRVIGFYAIAALTDAAGIDRLCRYQC